MLHCKFQQAWLCEDAALAIPAASRNGENVLPMIHVADVGKVCVPRLTSNHRHHGIARGVRLVTAFVHMVTVCFCVLLYALWCVVAWLACVLRAISDCCVVRGVTLREEVRRRR